MHNLLKNLAGSSKFLNRHINVHTGPVSVTLGYARLKWFYFFLCVSVRVLLAGGAEMSPTMQIVGSVDERERVQRIVSPPHYHQYYV